MASYIDFTLTFTDNSSGARDEDGTEIQIYTDSPSFVPNVIVDYAYAPHPWRTLPLVGAGVTSLPIRLKAPLNFVKVRVRQYNANGPGLWDTPGGGAGTLFLFPSSASVNAPEPPSAVGLAVTASPAPPVTSPVVTPPTPVPPSVASNYVWPTQFSGTQGSSGWFYKDSAGADLTYNSGPQTWAHSTEPYLGAWSGGMHPGPTLGSMLRWVVPQSGTAAITGNVNLYAVPGGGNGGTYTIKHLAATKYTQSMTDTTVYATAPAAFAVVAGDTIDFIWTSNQANNSFLSALVSINIALTSGGSPTNPVVAGITPATLAVNTGTVTSVTVGLSGNALVNSTLALSSSNTAVATVPSSIVIPIGQSQGAFDITGLAAGNATITATYNSTSAQCAVAVAAPPVGGQWPNQPTGMTQVTSAPFSGSFPAEWYNVYGTSPFSSPGGAGNTFSPPSALDVTLAAGSLFGNGEWGVNFAPSSEVYLGFFWSTNAAFQGNFHSSNKLLFVRNQNNDNNFVQWYGPQDAPKQIHFATQSLTYLNLHVSGWQGDGGSGYFAPNVNASAAMLASGSGWHFIELYLKKSTGADTRNGILKMWVDGVQTTNYTNINCTPSGFNNFVIAPTWDGTFAYDAAHRDITRSWHHYYDHVFLSRKP